MRFTTLEAIFRALNAAGARYLVVGGVAVNAHGYQRLTNDLDICLKLDSENLRAGLDALAGLGYRPILPVSLHDFADADKRSEWITHRNLQVFSLTSDRYPDATIDILAEVPFDFDEEYDRALVSTIAGLTVRFVRIERLIAIKEPTGRARDRDDVEHLRMILEEGTNE